MKQTITYSTLENLTLQGSFYETKEPTKKGLILYIHGGGLIYGTRDDLPETYIQKFLATGYSFLALDYPLVPEVRIDTILTTLEDAILSLPNHPDLAHENWENVYYFGRSAGAFMTTLLGASEKLPQPKGIIALYGYYSLTDPMMQQRSTHYQKFPAVPFMEVQKLIENEPLAVAPIYTRFPIYMSYRQSGTWVKELLGRKNKAEDFSLTDEDLKKLPRTFIAASSADQDVPFMMSTKMAFTIPDVETYFVNGLAHDFDADASLPTSIECYDKIMTWLD